MRLKPRAGSSPAFGTKLTLHGGFYFIKGDKSILSLNKIISLVFTSILLGLFVNYFNPEGIPLVREKLELNWAPDSIFNNMNEESPSDINDSSSRLITENDHLVNHENTNKEVTSREEPIQPQTIEEESNDEPKETISFTEPQAVTLEQAFKLYNNGVKFIDARDEADFLSGHIINSTNIPFDDLGNHIQKLDQLSKEKPMVIYCAGTDCDLSHLLANMLFEKGYKKIYVFFGGWIEWLSANYPIEKSSE